MESTVGARGKRVDHKRLAQWACDIAKRVLKGEEPALPKLESLLLGHDLRKSAGGELAMIGDLEWTATGQRPKATEPQMFDAWQFITVPVEKG